MNSPWHIKTIRLSSQICEVYLSHALQSGVKHCLSRATGSSRGHVEIWTGTYTSVEN